MILGKRLHRDGQVTLPMKPEVIVVFVVCVPGMPYLSVHHGMA